MENSESNKLDMATLVKEHITEKHGCSYIAVKYSVSANVIRDLLKKYGIYCKEYDKVISKPQKLPPDEQIIRDFNDGNKSLVELAAMYECSRERVRQKLEKLGIYNGRNKVDSVSIVFDYAVKQHSVEQLAIEYRTSIAIIRSVLRKNGVYKEDKQEKKKEKHLSRMVDNNTVIEVARKYIDEGITIGQLSIEYNVSYQTILRWIKKANIIDADELKDIGKQRSGKVYGKDFDIRIKKAYVEERMSIADIAEQVGARPTTIYKHLRKTGALNELDNIIKKEREEMFLKQTCRICKGIVKNGVCTCCGRTIAQMVAERK